MLYLVGYDLADPRYYPGLEEGILAAGGGIDLRNGPWLIGDARPADAVLGTLEQYLQAAGSTNDRLLVLPVHQGLIAPTHTRPSPHAETSGAPSVKVIAYTLRGPGRDYRPIEKAVRDLDARAFKPVKALWIVRTALTVRAVHFKIDTEAGLEDQDDLLVAEVPSAMPWAHRLLEPGVAQKLTRLLEAPLPVGA